MVRPIDVKVAEQRGYKRTCSIVCGGIRRQIEKLPLEEQRRLKSEYDKEYRAKNLELIKAKKAKHFQKTYDPVKAAIERKKRMGKHRKVERLFKNAPKR